MLNVSLAANRLNHEGTEPGAGGFPGFVQAGPNAGARLNEDVFALTGVDTVVIELGINDIWMNGDSTDAITDSLQKLATQLQEHGLAVIVCTITPFHGFEQSAAGSWTTQKEATRNAVNAFIRNNQNFDGVVDFDSLLSDPSTAPSFGPTSTPATLASQRLRSAADGRLLPAVTASLTTDGTRRAISVAVPGLVAAANNRWRGRQRLAGPGGVVSGSLLGLPAGPFNGTFLQLMVRCCDFRCLARRNP